jgi:predicted transcriptional regulator
MATLKVGIASYEEMKARTMAVARVERRVSRLVDNAFN